MNRNQRPRMLSGVMLVCAALLLPSMSLADLHKVVAAQVGIDHSAAMSQKRINAMLDKTQSASARYAQLMADAKSLESYNQQLSTQVDSQNREIASIDHQLAGIETTNREVVPLMQKMVNSLAKFVSLDVPFLPKERAARIKGLKEMMGRADVSNAEKYRQILQAYQTELDYGRTLGAYEGKLGSGPDARTVEFVRLGRISLMYRTLDGSACGYWNAHTHTWVKNDSYCRDIAQAFKDAKHEGAPVLLTVPVPAPVAAGESK